MFTASVATGFVSPAESYLSEPLKLEQFFQTNAPATFYMRAQDNRFASLGLNDGDVLVIDRSLAPYSGCLCVCAFGGELGLARYQKQNGKTVLRTASGKEISSQQQTAVTLWGVVAYLVRKM